MQISVRYHLGNRQLKLYASPSWQFTTVLHLSFKEICVHLKRIYDCGSDKCSFRNFDLYNVCIYVGDLVMT
jgi:hypothetical protein